MGYRSDVAIMFNKKGMEVMPQDVKDELSELAGDNITAFDEGDTLYRISGVKWYPSYEDVRKIKNFLSWLENGYDSDDVEEEWPTYEFVRIGEEVGDEEHYGNNDEDKLFISRTIEYID